MILNNNLNLFVFACNNLEEHLFLNNNLNLIEFLNKSLNLIEFVYSNLQHYICLNNSCNLIEFICCWIVWDVSIEFNVYIFSYNVSSVDIDVAHKLYSPVY